ncbi:MAG: hypothetical protein LBH39_00215 [Clostridiales Family XIII bacterium]|jgi:tetratricopeptide (TPR) repeat protein|nr:hypothetical protein [Clostridiales Family XIII bacterium]
MASKEGGRPRDKYDLPARADRIGPYLDGGIDRFVFDEFSEGYIERNRMHFMRGIPIPLEDAEARSLQSEGSLSIPHLCKNMAWIMGVSPRFPFSPVYAKFLRACMKDKAAGILIAMGNQAVAEGEMKKACVHFRAALCVAPRARDALYGYAIACREIYRKGGEAGYVANFKAEALEYFELTTEAHPDFPMGHYFLGYAYLNLGLYRKAYLAWKDYLGISDDDERRKEIEERASSLSVPMKIEQGCNDILSGKYQQGISVLEGYLKTKYKDWWPLYYYLGTAYKKVLDWDRAESMFKELLRRKPSHVEAMQELAAIYGMKGKPELYEKYTKKAAAVDSEGRSPSANAPQG